MNDRPPRAQRTSNRDRFGPIRRVLRLVTALDRGEQLDTARVQELAATSPAHARRLKQFLTVELDLGVQSRGKERLIHRRLRSAVHDPTRVGVVAIAFASAAMQMFRDSDIYERWRELAAQLLEQVTDAGRSDFERLERAIVFRRRIHTDVRAVRSVLRSLTEAIAARKIVTISYANGVPGSAQARRVEPWSLMVCDGVLYLVAFDIDEQRRKNWRLDRIQQMGETGTTFRYPPRLRYDPDELFAPVFGMWVEDGSPTEEVSLYLRGPFVAHLEKVTIPGLQSRSSDSDGLRLVLCLQVTPELEGWVLSLGEYCEVLGPPSLRETIGRRHCEAAAKYTISPIR